MKTDYAGKVFKRRLFMSFFGVMLSGVSVGIFKSASFGVDPFGSVVFGLDSLIPIEYGLVYILINAVLILFSLVFDRKNIGVATFINLFLVGYVTQFSYGLVQRLCPEPGLFERVLLFVFGFVLACFAASLYMTAALGVSTYDAVAITLSGKYHLGQFRFIRILTDLCCVLSGSVMYCIGAGPSALSEIIGAGTVIIALGMGPLIDVFNRRVSQPFLDAADGKI